MSAFYVMRYVGAAGQGGGAMFIGKGILAGVDVMGGKYEGRYIERGGRLKGTVKLTSPQPGLHLVTGQTVPGGQSFNLQFELPSNFANGQPQTIIGVGGQPVQVTFEKIADLP
jgi:hypothetical protein